MKKNRTIPQLNKSLKTYSLRKEGPVLRTENSYILIKIVLLRNSFSSELKKEVKYLEKKTIY